MSSPIHSNAHKPKRLSPLLWLIPILAVGALILLVLAYFGTGYLLTRQIDTLYVERDCKSLIEKAEYIQRFYPSGIASFADPSWDQALECHAYLKADSLRENREWNAAYDAYLNYQSSYPNGIYTKEARDFAAESLFEMAVRQRQQHDYAGAVENLALLLDKFKNTPIISKTKAEIPEVYLEWGQECRADDGFIEAETVYLSLTSWAEQETDQSSAERAQTELSQTYFDWGMKLQSKKEFQQAAGKFDKAIATDPSPNSTDSIAAKTRAHLPGFQRAWGEYLLAQGKYPDAVSHFKNSVNLSLPQDVASAQDALAQAYLKWAESLRKSDSYYQALDRIEDASKVAASIGNQENAEEAHALTLDLFSKSKGAQAQNLITDASSSICQNGKPLESLPIIGVLEEKRLTLSGVNLVLPANIRAQAPGNLHLVACAEEKEIILQNCPYSWTGYGTITHWIKRIRYEWQIKIFDSQTGKLINQKTFQGSAPQYCPQRYSFGSSDTAYFRGDKPTASTVTDWLASLLK
jgi:tetratricopeptide (TPR) repeat protein